MYPSGNFTQCAANSASAPCTLNPTAFPGDDVKSINIFKFGWIYALSYAEGELHADPDRVNGDFEEMVQAGSF